MVIFVTTEMLILIVLLFVLCKSTSNFKRIKSFLFKDNIKTQFGVHVKILVFSFGTLSIDLLRSEHDVSSKYVYKNGAK